MTINKVSQAVKTQVPQFIEDNYPLFDKFLEYYYKSQERTGYGQNILNEFLGYLNIDNLNTDILGGSTLTVRDVTDYASVIPAENIDSFLSENGTILIDDEVIFYEKAVASPSIALSPGISIEQVRLKWSNLVNLIDQFDGVTRSFELKSQDVPVSPPTVQHLIVKLYDRILIPSVDFVIEGSNIVFTQAPRAKTPADSASSCSITYLNGFSENPILELDNISGSFLQATNSFQVTRSGSAYQPIVDEYVIAIYDGRVLTPKEDFTFDRSSITFSFSPQIGKRLDLYSIEAPIPSFGNGAVGFSRVSNGQITSVEVKTGGSNYVFEYPPKVSITSEVGQNASVKPLIDGIKNIQLLNPGRGYSDTNPPVVEIESPTKIGGNSAKIEAVVTNGSISDLVVLDSGSGYTFTPRVNFKQPGGASIANPVVSNGSIVSVELITGGENYTTSPEIYIDAPTAEDGIAATLRANLNDLGQVASVTVINPGSGYETTPRVAIVDPVGAQVLEVSVDDNGRLTNIELLTGGSGYEDVPSVYIVDDRLNDLGVYIGGAGAKAVAAIFNGQITDINITDFGIGYSQENPPKVIIQSPPSASASVNIGVGEITGFDVISPGSDYLECRFEGCSRGFSGIVDYTENGDVVFSNNTTPSSHSAKSEVKCLDALFVKRVLDKYKEQYLPDIPELDYENIDVKTAIKNIKTFYSTKGTQFSYSYLFKLLYGENISVSYPKDQIIKPSASTWTTDTILRATLVSGNPNNIQDSLLEQFEDIADPAIRYASALVENYIAIKTSEFDIYELTLSQETINGNFIVPYKTKLAEPLTETTDIITVDSTIGWPERNGEFIIGETEIIRYKEKSLNQFIECTRGTNARVWDAATEVKSNFFVYLNKDTPQEVILNIVGIVDAQQTTLTDTGSYYLPGDKLIVSKLGGTSESPQLTSWLYNVKKLLEVSTITYGGINNRFATVTTSTPHGLLVGDQVTVYGANPILFNGTFLVTSRDSETTFQYQLAAPAAVIPQGNILISVDLNKGKSTNAAVNKAISPYTTNVQNAFFNDNYVYVASTSIPNYEIGPFPGSALSPGNQRKLNRITFNPQTISTKTKTSTGPIGTWINGVSAWSYKSQYSRVFGPITSIDILNAGQNYDAASPPNITISANEGTGAQASVVVNGSIDSIEVIEGGSGYTTSPLVSIVGGGGSGASATAIVTRGSVSRILINDGGTGYTSRPEINIVGGAGSGAEAVAQVRGPIQSITIDNGGEGYVKKPEVSLSSGSGAVAQAIVNAGRIISIAIISGGSGYTTAPEISIQGEGFGAVARASIDVDGENAGKVTNIEILNRGIGYVQGSTVINLTSVGQNASFEANVFEWVYNLQETLSFDSAEGAIFEGYNTQYGGEYAHISNPRKLRFILGDNMFENASGEILELDDQLEHSPIIGWAHDGNPIYGPYGYSDPTDQSSSLVRMRSSYSLKANLVFGAISNPYPVRTAGPLLSQEYAGRFIDDYEYVFGSGDLDQYNGRFCKTPDFPEGRYCYFITIDNTEFGNPVFPYIVGPEYNSTVDTWNLSADAVQQNIPTGVVRYRDPYEGVDIDVQRSPNASTNALTTEDGDILLFEVEDENRDGIISQDEIDDPEQIFEESPLQLYDYFPKVKIDSKVDIEVETISKFEDAAVSGFIIEDPGINYQVNDIIVFDETDTDGIGVSARVSKIKGETVSSYDYETISGINYGVLTTDTPHNIGIGDRVYVDYSPIMDNTNKTFIVRQYRGIEEVIVTQTGSGYNTDIPPEIVVEGDGNSGKIESVLTNVGSISEFNIVNSGSGYTENPRVILSHPQVFKRSDYFVSQIGDIENIEILDVSVNADKESFVCGKALRDDGDTVAFVAKISSLGTIDWVKTLETTTPALSSTYIDFNRIFVDANNIWVVGNTNPNTGILSSYNPDVVLAKYTQASDGLSASLTFQKGYAGISGSTRSDNVTAIKQLSDTRIIIGGFTNTNSTNPMDGFVAILDTAGSFINKRKIASQSDSEKITDFIISNGNVYFIMESADNDSTTNIDVSLGKLSIGIISINVDWIKQITTAGYSFIDTSISIDEFDELYITSTLRDKVNQTRDSFSAIKLNRNADIIWNYRYQISGGQINLVSKNIIDIFGDLNLVYSKTDATTSEKTVSSVKLNYNGEIIAHSQNNFIPDADNSNNTEGLEAFGFDVDVSGDVYIFGKSYWNNNEFIHKFDSDATDEVGHYTPTLVGNDSTESLVILGDGTAQIRGEDVANPGTWENAAIQYTGASLGTKLDGDWTLEFMLYKASAIQSGTQAFSTLVGIGDATNTTGGLWLYYDMVGGELTLVVTNSSTALTAASGSLQSTQTNMYTDDTWQFVAIKKESDAYTVYINGTQVMNGTIANTSFANKDLWIGNQPGWGGGSGVFTANTQGQYYIDNLRLKNLAVTPTVPSDVTDIPPTATFALGYTWTDTDWFAEYQFKYDYRDYKGFGIKVDKNSDAIRVGNIGLLTNSKINLTRSNITPVGGVSLTLLKTDVTLADSGLQSLDFNDVNTSFVEDTESLTISSDIWSSRNATVPAPGSQKVKATAVVKDRYYIKVTDTLKIDNIQELTLNQNFNFTVGGRLVLRNGEAFVNSGYITKIDHENNKVYLAVNNNSWSNDLNLGELTTERFDEQSTYGIRGPVVNDINEINTYEFTDVVNTTPGTFDIALSDYNAPADIGGTENLNQFAKFKPYATSLYLIRIVETSGTSPFIPGSVVEVSESDISFNADYNTIQITGLTAVTKISLVTNLQKIIQVTSVSNSDEVYVITDSSHYLKDGEMIFIDGNPTTEQNGVVYDEYDGSFSVERVLSVKEFIYKLNQVAVGQPSATGSNVSIFVKSPTLKMYYGHQYIFDVSHPTLLGTNLSFSKDSLFKLEYSFNSIERIGTPGVVGQNQPLPSVKLKIDENIVTNISYYFDPSRVGKDSPIDSRSFLDIVKSPYFGDFLISETRGGTITRGDDTIVFPLINEPEGPADAINASYSTSSEQAVGSISDIRIVSPGGFYTKLPIITDIQSNRKIERVQINDPGTEYVVGEYTSVPISGDGEGGLVTITVEDTTNDEGDLIPGRVVEVVVTSPGKGYTTASIDVEAIDGILGPGLAGSGADLEVIIPPFGTGASIFTVGNNVGKIKKLKNNNFGYDYTHDYTLRPEITFPLNAQLISTNILESITITDPGSGYSQAPAVIITGGGGSGATAEATIKNGRLDQIIVKDPGAGYSSQPTIELKSSFNYVINLDLGLLQFSFPHNIPNGSEVTLNAIDLGDGVEFPLASGAIGRLNGTTTYYAIAGDENSLDGDQLKLALTPTNAELGDAIQFSNAGVGRQQVLTSSFGGAAEGNVVTSTFSEGELIYQGGSLETATATGYVSTNNGWQEGPRILKIVNYDGNFTEGERVTGVISKSSGIISNLKIARGVLEIGPITKTTGQFIDDVGKPSEIIQRIQDSYYYQDFSYAINSSVSINEWKDTVIKNVHPSSFKVFGQLGITEETNIPNKETDFSLTKSVELAREATVPNIQNFALVEPIYQESNNTEVLFRQKRLTSSENILTSVVQRVDDISHLFDGKEIAFPLTVEGNNVIANENQLMVILNGVAQTPGTAFTVQNDSIVFSQPPQPAASVRYVSVGLQLLETKIFTFINVGGIFPNPGDVIVGSVSKARATVVSTIGSDIRAFTTEGSFILPSGGSSGELVTVGATGFAANINTISDFDNNGLFQPKETVRNFNNDVAEVERVNLETGQESPAAIMKFGAGISSTNIEVIPAVGENTPIASGVFEIGKRYQAGSEIFEVINIVDNSNSSTITVLRGQLGTTAVAHLQSTPIYGTEIQITNDLILSKTTGTYQSTPGLYNIQLNDVIIAEKSGVVAKIISTTPYRDPVTNEVVSEVVISQGSTFFGLLFNRIASTEYPNIILDNLSESQVNIVDYDDYATPVDSRYPENEIINNYIITYNNETGDLQTNELIKNYTIEHSNSTGDFIQSEPASVRKLTFKNIQGSGLFQVGQTLRSENTKAQVVGYSQAKRTVYLGKMARVLSTGEDYHTATFNGSAQLSSSEKKFGDSSLLLDGIDSYISFASSTDFGFGTGDFTIDLWIKPNSVAVGDKHIFDTRDSGADANAGRLYLAGDQLRYNIGVSDVVTSGATTLSANTWYHIAVSRSGTDLRLFVDGVEVGSTTNSTDLGSTKRLFLGSNFEGSNVYPGYIDSVRVSNTARYTEEFTTPNGPFSGDANALLLLNFDEGDGKLYTDDWSGEANWTTGHFFNNDVILSTQRSTDGSASYHSANTQRYFDAANLLNGNKNLISEEVTYQIDENLPREFNSEDVISTVAQDAASYTTYGTSVAIGGGVIVVGADGASTYRGAAYIYDYNLKNEIKITGSDLSTYEYFGEKVAVGNGKIVVGAPQHTSLATRAGAAYVYDLDGTNEIKLLPSDLSDYAYFGSAVAIGNNKIAVAANRQYDATNSFNTGAVYLYDLDGTNEIKVTASLQFNNAYFGWDIAISDNKLIVGAYNEYTSMGRIYTYDLDGTNERIITATDAQTYDYFGYSIAAGDGKIFVGARGADTVVDGLFLNDAGKVYIMDLDGSNQISFFNPENPTAYSQFGHNLAYTAGKLFVGERYGDEGGINMGGLFVFDVDGTYTNQYVYSSDFGSEYAYGIGQNRVEFTSGLAAGDDRVIVGAEDWNGVSNNGFELSDSGRVWLYSLNFNGEIDYKNEIGGFVDDMIHDLRHGSNRKHWDRAVSFVERSVSPPTLLRLSTQSSDAIDAFNIASGFAKSIINNQAITITGDHGLTQVYNNTLTDSGDDGNSAYTSGDCADVLLTIDNLTDIVTDTIAAAGVSDPLATVTRLAEEYSFLGATVDSFIDVPVDITDVDNPEDAFYANQIDTDARNVYLKAADLIRSNRGAIVDKAAYDLITRYPDLAADMPRNGDGSGSGTLRCKTDLGLILDNLAKDIELGGNENTIFAGRSYLGNSDVLIHIRLQVWQSVYAHERLGYYAKEAINGTIDETNTNSVVIKDWDNPQIPGQYVNVETSIDELTTLLNYIIAPTDDQYHVAADRLYFNRDLLREESLYVAKQNYKYTLNGVDFTAYDFTVDNAENIIKNDMERIIIALISDLQTGGNFSAVDEIQKYFTANLEYLRITDIAGEFSSAIYALRASGNAAIRNALFGNGESGSVGIILNPYIATIQGTQLTGYRDALTPSNIQDVADRWDTLIDLVMSILIPSESVGTRSAVKQLEFNKAYYQQEISTQINNQFGVGTWEYDSFLNTVVEDIIHDTLITDVSASNIQQAKRIELLRDGVIESILFDGGSGYTEAPTVVIDPPPAGGIQATAEAILSTGGSIDSITIDTAGSGYTYPPIAIFNAGNVPSNAHKGSTEISGGQITEVRYDGITHEFDNYNDFIRGSGVYLYGSGSGFGSTGGFNVGTNYFRFGGGSGSRYVTTVNSYDLTNVDRIRTYAIAGNGSNGGEVPDSNKHLYLQYSTNNSNWYTIDTVILGASDSGTDLNGQQKNASSMATPGKYVDLSVPSDARRNNVYLRWIQYSYISSYYYDHYGLIKFGLLNTSQVFDPDLSVSFTKTLNDQGTVVAPTVTVSLSTVIESIDITNRGSGYLPNNPPTATLSGGAAITPGSITDVSVVLDTNRFDVGEYIYSDGGGSALVLEDAGNAIYIGDTIGFEIQDGDVLSQLTSSGTNVTAEVPINGVGDAFDWYLNAGNLQTTSHARQLTSLIEDEESSYNYLSTPEQFNYTNWGIYNSYYNLDIEVAPDDTVSADTLRANGTYTQHGVRRITNLTSYETFDSTFTRFDSELKRFSEGANSTSDKQTWTTSYFIKSDGLDRGRLQVQLYPNPYPNINIDFNVNSGVIEGVFNTTNGAIEIDDYGMIPYGNGWYRIYATVTFGYGFSQLYSYIWYKSQETGSLYFSESQGRGMFIWGSKLNQGFVDTYTSVAGIKLYVNREFNIKKYALNLLSDLMESALIGNLPSPSTYASYYAYSDSNNLSQYVLDSMTRIVRSNISIIENQLENSEYYLDVVVNSGIRNYTDIQYGERTIPTPISGGVTGSDYIYGNYSNTIAEINFVNANEAKIVAVYKRFRIDNGIDEGPFDINGVVAKQGDAGVTGIVYGRHQDENYDYLDVEVTSGNWQIGDIIEGGGDAPVATATISAIENRIQIIDLTGNFETGVEFRGSTSTETANTVNFLKTDAAVISNTGGKLVVDTETLNGLFETTSVVYSENSRIYLDAKQYAGPEIKIGDRIVSDGYTRISIGIIGALNQFEAGRYIYKMTNNVRDLNNYGIITSVDLDNNYIYLQMIEGSFENGNIILHFDDGGSVIGQASISTKLVVEGAATGVIQDIRDIGIDKRLYISNLIGTFDIKDTIRSADGYIATLIGNAVLKARVRRAVKGFDGIQTTFPITTNNGDSYLPDPAGHILVFVNGILQPPNVSYTAYSNVIEFSEAPSLGSSFTGFYVGKLRQLDDISFDFDSLRQSFNLKRNGLFYSLTLTDGVQSSTIRPENNIIVSLNGVIQEPGVGFELVGSRIIFSEVPRVGSTFVAFSYVGSEADVVSADVVPPIEPGDDIDIDGETSDREVAVIESSNSLITFDYLGSVFGRDAEASANLLVGYVDEVGVTSPGSGYTSRPLVRVDSITGFDANIKALVGVGGVEVVSAGSGYKNPDIQVETTVPDDWTPPNLSDYGEEVIDPEVIT